jgi:hypothetical protein
MQRWLHIVYPFTPQRATLYCQKDNLLFCACRGFLDSSGQLRVRDYPYAEDGLLLWEALQRYFTASVGLYYADDAAVKKDTWLQEW